MVHDCVVATGCDLEAPRGRSVAMLPDHPNRWRDRLADASAPWSNPRAESFWFQSQLSESNEPLRLVQQFRILVVDDEDTIREVVADALQLEGYSVLTASNGLEALTVVESDHPSLIILDMRMPVLDGWGFARLLRQRGHDIPIVVITAAQNARRWADDIGAPAFLPKPFDLDELFQVVERFRSRA